MKWWLVVVILAVVIIRGPALPVRTPHIDEGMGIRATELVLAGEWRYSPQNGHGPTLFFLAAPIRAWLGINFIAFRFLTAIAMLAVIGLLWWQYRRELGLSGQVILWLGLGLSPGLLFFSVYFIHEALFLLFTVMVLVAAERWLTTRRDSWLTIATIAAGLMYFTKETALFTYAAWFLAGLVLLLSSGRWQSFFRSFPYRPVARGLVVIGLGYLFFFGFNLDPVRSPFLWLTERGLSMHLRPWYYFPVLLARHEFLLVLAAMTGSVVLLVKQAWTARGTFFGLWLVLITVMYSLVPYKTPWLSINMTLPLGLLAVWSTIQVWPYFNRFYRSVFGAGGVVLLLLSAGQLWSDNFYQPDRVEAYSYAYLQSDDNLQRMFDRLDGWNAEYLAREQRKLPLQILGRGDELLHVMTESYDRRYPPFSADLPVYINYQQDLGLVYDLLGPAAADYQLVNFRYFAPGPGIDFLIRNDLKL